MCCAISPTPFSSEPMISCALRCVVLSAPLRSVQNRWSLAPSGAVMLDADDDETCYIITARPWHRSGGADQLCTHAGSVVGSCYVTLVHDRALVLGV